MSSVKIIGAICTAGCLALLITPLSLMAAPMDEVFPLLESGGGVASGRDSQEGYYVTALGFSSRSSESDAFEEARLEAMRYLNEMVNGVTVSGSSTSTIEHVSRSGSGVDSEYSEQTFQEVVALEFKGQLASAKQLKRGEYDGDYFVAISLSQKDLAEAKLLRGDAAAVPSSSDGTETVAEFDDSEKSVESKGLASMKVGEQSAREQALLDAMRNAVQQVQGVMLSGKSGVFNEALSYALSTKTEGYVSSYEVVDEDIARGNYQVVIVAQVNGGKLLNDVNFYLDAFDDPVFTVSLGTGGGVAWSEREDWLTRELEKLGFTLSDDSADATHTFHMSQQQQVVKNHNGKEGIETVLTLQLKENSNGEILFTIRNDPLKSRIYVTPVDRARQVSEVSAYKALGKQLGFEVVDALAKRSERGRIHIVEIRNARRSDWQLFKHVLNNNTSGEVEGWEWSSDGKVMMLNYRYGGKLSTAMDEGLESLYQTYRTEGDGRRPTAISIEDGRAVFEMIGG